MQRSGIFNVTVTFLLLCGTAGLPPAATPADAADAADTTPADTPSGYRRALLLGNSHYKDFTLPGVAAGLDLLQPALEKHGFVVTRHEDLAEKEQKSAVDTFAASVPTNGVALVYYAGLAAHLERQGKLYNLLRPVGAKITSENDYRSRGLRVADLIKSLDEKSGARTRLLFLDACRASPIKPATDRVLGGLRALEVDASTADDIDIDTTVMFAAASARTTPVTPEASPSALATALSRHAGTLDTSVRATCHAIATALGNEPWFGGATDSGLGPPPTHPPVPILRDGRSPGDGFVNSTGMTFRWCPPGSFEMGSPRTDTPATRDRAAVEVTLSRGFWMGEHEVTQREYQAVMRKNPPRGFTLHTNAPFWGVTESKQITQFCDKLNDLERKAGTLPDGWKYTCPSEAEWEYACRAGSTTPYCFGDSIAELGLHANFADKALHTADPDFYWADTRSDDGVGAALATVGSYRPNAWGLRDMHGNVAEVVADHLLPELPGGTDPLVQVKKDGRTQIRGGAWCSLALYCESSFRNSPPGRDKHDFVGFRVALKKVR